MPRLLAVMSLVVVVFAGSAVIRAAAPPAVQSLPSGERILGQTVIEPAYDDETGNIIYLMTPIHAPFPSKANSHAVSPLYLVVYPTSASGFVGTMNCAHQPEDNCPDHGPDIAGLAQAVQPGVYGAGVWGHDHLVDGPGGSEFNVAWHVVVILFTNSTAARTHITTDAQIDAALDAGDAIEIPTDIIFNCNVVSAATYRRAVPFTLGLPQRP